MQIAIFQNFVFLYETEKLSAAHLLSRSFTQRELRLNQLKHKQLPPQLEFAALTHDVQNKPEHYMVKHETVFPSQKDDCHQILVDFGNYQFSNRNDD